VDVRQYCVKGMIGTYAATDRDGTTTQGGYSTHVVVDADYVLSIPESLDPAAATPLLCAGITTYSPLKHWNAGPGTRVAVGAPPEPLDVNVFALLTNRRSFSGSMIGGIAETQEMLDFCAEHGIAAEVEVTDVEQVNEAYERVLASDVRYRFVIDASTLA